MSIGCANHTVEIMDRGGTRRIGVPDNPTSIKWGRKRDDMSMASATFAAPSIECAHLLDMLEPNRHELVVYRNGDRVWEGPISHLEYQGDTVTIEARDVMYYAYRLIMKSVHPLEPWTTGPRPLVVSRAMEVLTTEMARREAEDPPINVVPHLIGFIAATDPTRTYRETEEFKSTVFEDLDSLAQYAGLDYVAVGRRIILSDVRAAWHTTQAVSEADFMGPLSITSYGLQGATFAAVTDGEGAWGAAAIEGEDYYGHWEVLETAAEEEPEEGVLRVAPTAVGDVVLEGVEEFAKQARTTLTGAYPVPTVVYVPQGSQLAPSSILQVQDLIPGVRVPLRARLGSRSFSVMQKLDAMDVTEDGNGEQISVDLSAASLKDEAALPWEPEEPSP